MLTRALDKEEEIDTAPLVAQVVLSLTNQFYILRILEPSIKLKMYEDISDILMAEFKINLTELEGEGLGEKDSKNLRKVVQELTKKKSKLNDNNLFLGNFEHLKSNIMSTHSLDE